MRDRIFQLYKELQKNNHNCIIYFEKNKRFVKTFSEFHSDIEGYIARFNHLKISKPIENIAILGPTSYKWLVIDHACIKGGYRSVGIPEAYSPENIVNILTETKVDMLLCDYNLKDRYKFNNVETYYYNCNEVHQRDFEKAEQLLSIENIEKNLILEDYSIVFSSGSSEKVKKIIRSFVTRDHEKKTLIGRIKFIFVVINYKLSFWSRSDNKVIIFMPFSHPINRANATQALRQKINIVLSNPQECLKHIITERPNIIFAIPIVYEAIAQVIKQKIKKFAKSQKILFYLFNKLKLNALSNRNPLKLLFSFFLFKKIRKMYGGKADYFVTGSAPIDPEVQKIFYSVGVKVFDAYGQTESANIMSDHKNFRIGSVGRPKKGMAEISDDGELLLKYEEKHHSKNKDILNISGEWIRSGDLAYIDKDGFLFITGRKDDLIVLDNGKKVNPHKIERSLLQYEAINHALVFSKNALNIYAIIDVKEPKKEAGNEIKEIISKSNISLARYEQITNFHITNEHFTTENGLLTGTLKMKRKAIVEKYGNGVFDGVNVNN